MAMKPSVDFVITFVSLRKFFFMVEGPRDYTPRP